MHYGICSSIYILLSTFYQLLSSIYALHLLIYHLPCEPIYTLLSMFYQLLALYSTIYPVRLIPTLYSLHSTSYSLWHLTLYDLPSKPIQGCALAAPGRLRRLTFGLGRLKKKSGRPSGRLDFGLCENPKRNEQTYWNGMERNEKNFLMLPCSR